MRFAVVMIGLMLGSGCTRFSGEWLEEGVVKRDGTFVPADGTRRQAMRFDWPATIRVGAYADAAGVVDEETVQWDQYWTLQNDHVAQAGAMSARVKDGKLMTVVDGDVKKVFTKVNGPSIFPPQVKCPSLSAQ